MIALSALEPLSAAEAALVWQDLLRLNEQVRRMLNRDGVALSGILRTSGLHPGNRIRYTAFKAGRLRYLTVDEIVRLYAALAGQTIPEIPPELRPRGGEYRASRQAPLLHPGLE